MNAAPDTGQEMEICRNCALCCDGTLFDSVPLEKDEVRRLADTAGRQQVLASKWTLPCALLAGNDCSIYADRPSACRSYRCLLLRDFNSGRRTKDECGKLATEARTKRDEILAELEGFETRIERLEEVKRRLEAVAAGKTAADAISVKVIALERFLDRVFRNAGEGRER